ncbi:MAG: ABC transporter permease [Pseudobutyrivibrio sp.]|nr:ABC transporter permease [Pseudobutyrivibrio sp.]
MTIFKATIKSLRSYAVTIIVYMSVFILFGTMQGAMMADSSEKVYEDSAIKVAILDYDDSTLSHALVDYVDSTQILTDAGSEDLREINDNLRFDIYSYAIIIPEGFEEDVLSGHSDDSLEYMSNNQSAAGYLMTEKIRTYLTDIVVYLNSGYDTADAIRLTQESMEELNGISANIISEDNHSSTSKLARMFIFCAYSLLMLLAVCIGSILNYMKEPDSKNRIAVSGMPFVKRYAGLISAVLVIGLGLTASLVIFTGISGSIISDVDKFGYYALNMFTLMFIGIGLAYFVGSIAKDENTVNMVSNMIVLSMSFLCGVFVPMEFLTDKIIKAAHFLPLYWYVTAADYIDNHSAGQVISPQFIQYLLIQLIFAIIFFVAGLIISKKREQYAI